MSKKTIRIGSRKSKLAMIQTEMVAKLLRESHPELETEIVTMDTSGDIILDKPLSTIGGKGLFTLELEQALRQGEIDLSVHSLKDMPEDIPEDLPILAYSRREDPRDALILPEGKSFEGFDRLAGGKPIGCSSARRALQLSALCPHLSVESVRGNVPTRIKKLDSGDYCALILAAAGLKRLNLQNRISKIFSPEEMLPAAGQGIIAIQGRKDFPCELLDCVDDSESRTAGIAERAVIAGLNCGCSSPAAAYCQVFGEKVKLSALYADPQTGQKASGTICGGKNESLSLAKSLSSRLLHEAGTFKN